MNSNNALQVFDNGTFNVRTLNDDAGIWFVAKDVAEALDYSESGISNMGTIIAHVPEIWKGRKRITTPGGEQEMLCLSEQGLYFFLGRSDKPKALPYQMWIAGDVVPSIRKTGRYEVAAKQEAVPEEWNETPPSNAPKDKISYTSRGMMSSAKKIYDAVWDCKEPKDFLSVLALDELFKHVHGESALEVAGIKFVKDRKIVYTKSEHAMVGWAEEFFKWEHNFPELPE